MQTLIADAQTYSDQYYTEWSDGVKAIPKLVKHFSGEGDADALDTIKNYLDAGEMPVSLLCLAQKCMAGQGSSLLVAVKCIKEPVSVSNYQYTVILFTRTWQSSLSPLCYHHALHHMSSRCCGSHSALCITRHLSAAGGSRLHA